MPAANDGGLTLSATPFNSDRVFGLASFATRPDAAITNVLGRDARRPVPEVRWIGGPAG